MEIKDPGEGQGHHHVHSGGDAAGPQVVAVAMVEGGGAGEVKGDGHGRGGVWQCGAAGWKGRDGNAGADTYGAARGRGE